MAGSSAVQLSMIPAMGSGLIKPFTHRRRQHLRSNSIQAGGNPTSVSRRAVVADRVGLSATCRISHGSFLGGRFPRVVGASPVDRRCLNTLIMIGSSHRRDVRNVEPATEPATETARKFAIRQPPLEHYSPQSCRETRSGPRGIDGLKTAGSFPIPHGQQQKI
jgi:hypothetical protein